MGTFMQSIEVGSSVDYYSDTLLTGTHIIASCWSDEYAIVNLSLYLVGSNTYIQNGSTSSDLLSQGVLKLNPGSGTDLFIYPNKIYIGPSKSLRLVVTSGSATKVSCSGVIFKNI